MDRSLSHWRTLLTEISILITKCAHRHRYECEMFGGSETPRPDVHTGAVPAASERQMSESHLTSTQNHTDIPRSNKASSGPLDRGNVMQ